MAKLSRRDFLRSTGAGAALLPAAAATGSSDAHAGPDAAPPALGPAPVPLTLQVNGKALPVKVRPLSTLAEVLRDTLGLTGTKIGCDRGACGACTVWVDGEPQPACSVLVLDVAGAAITTIEGLAQGPKLHPVQEQFIAHDALQCGYCTPGMIMSCAALHRRLGAQGRGTTEAEVREAIAGNLCRCGAYPNIIAATLAACRKGGTP